MSDRLVKWVKEEIDNAGSEYNLLCGLQNGEIQQPEWVSSGSQAIGWCVWDNEESDGSNHLYNLSDKPEDNN